MKYNRIFIIKDIDLFKKIYFLIFELIGLIQFVILRLFFFNNIYMYILDYFKRFDLCSIYFNYFWYIWGDFSWFI